MRRRRLSALRRISGEDRPGDPGVRGQPQGLAPGAGEPGARRSYVHGRGVWTQKWLSAGDARRAALGLAWTFALEEPCVTNLVVPWADAVASEERSSKARRPFVIRSRTKATQVGEFLGLAPTGRRIVWDSIAMVWVKNGRVSCWCGGLIDGEPHLEAGVTRF